MYYIYLINYLYNCIICIDVLYVVKLQMGKKKGVGTNAGGGASGSVSAGTYGRGTSASGGVYGRVASATGGASGRGTGASGSGGTSANGGGASRKAKVMVVPTVQKVMERIAAKTKKTT